MTHNFPLTFLALNVFSLISGSLDVFIEQNMMSLGKPFQHHNIVEAGSNISVFDSFFFLYVLIQLQQMQCSLLNVGILHVSVATGQKGVILVYHLGLVATKTSLWGFRQSKTHTGLFSYRD